MNYSVADTTLPSIAITSPVASGQTYSTGTATVTVSGTASDNVGVISVYVANNRGGAQFASGTTNWSATGISLQSGSNILTAHAIDAAGNDATTSITVNYSVPGSTPALSITTTSLPSATVGTGYAQGVSVSGGQTPYTWSVSSGLPSGLNINSTTGAIYGTPSVSGTFNFTVTVTDSSSPQKTSVQGLSLIVSPSSTPALSLGTPVLLSPGNGAPVSGTSVTLSWNGVSGAGAYSVGLRDQSSGFLATIPLVTGTSYTASVIQGHSYVWDVASCTSVGGGDNVSNCPNRASNWSFTVQAVATALATPTGATPGSISSPGPTQSSSTVGLSWGAVSGATYYSLGVTDMATGTLVVDTTTNGTSYTASLTVGRQYRWNVAAYNTAGRSTYTTLLYFQTPTDAATTASHPPYPVIFIHGINSDSSTWANFRDNLISPTVRYGGSLTVFDGRVVNTPDNVRTLGRVDFTNHTTGLSLAVDPVIRSGAFYALDFSDNINLTFGQQGWELAKIIAKVREVNIVVPFNAPKVILVAHSMGGLAARAYLEGLARNQTTYELLPYNYDVEKLITVGTPHLGSPWPRICDDFGYVNLICAVFGGGSSVAMESLRTTGSPELDALNLNKRNLPPINYVSIVVGGMFLSAAGLDENGDGIVSVSSQNLASGEALPTNPINISLLHKPLPSNGSIYIDPWCSGLLHLGAESHTCEPRNSSVQGAILSELQGTSLTTTAFPTANTFGISGTPGGPLTARTLTVTVQPPADALGTPIQTFVAATVNQLLYFLTPRGWQPWTGGDFPAYATGTFAAETTGVVGAQTIQVLDGSMDLSGLVGAQAYVGYGISGSEMLSSMRYTLVYTVQ